MTSINIDQSESNQSWGVIFNVSGPKRWIWFLILNTIIVVHGPLFTSCCIWSGGTLYFRYCCLPTNVQPLCELSWWSSSPTWTHNHHSYTPYHHHQGLDRASWWTRASSKCAPHAFNIYIYIYIYTVHCCYMLRSLLLQFEQLVTPQCNSSSV